MLSPVALPGIVTLDGISGPIPLADPSGRRETYGALARPGNGLIHEFASGVSTTSGVFSTAHPPSINSGRGGQAPREPPLIGVELSDPILDPLNLEQRAAVTHGDGPLLILAGAGSGKTRVLTHRVAYLIRDLGVQASAILAVTFTNKAAREMKERLERLVGKELLAELTVGTFHAFCARLLRREGPLVGVDRSFAIYDEADQRAVLRQAMSDTQVNERVSAPGAIGAVISSAKNELKGPADLGANPKGQLDRIVAIAGRR